MGIVTLQTMLDLVDFVRQAPEHEILKISIKFNDGLGDVPIDDLTLEQANEVVKILNQVICNGKKTLV